METVRLEKRFGPLTGIDLPDWCSWMGAVSIGVRSHGSLGDLAASAIQLQQAALVTYPRKGTIDEATASKRDRNLAQSRNLLSAVLAGNVEEREFSQYAATPLTALLRIMCAKAKMNCGRTILDVTGLTKFHTVVAAAEAATRRHEDVLTLAYSIPENYIGFARRERYSAGFGETLILPLVDGAKLRHESRARGIILPGHEGQRLLVALGEIDPIGGTIIHAVTPGRPDFEQVTRHRNKPVYDDLRESGKWRDFSVDFRSARSVANHVRLEVRRARAEGGPVLIYPFGPKPVIFAAAFTAARLYPEGSWFVYPIPSTSSSQHTEGLSRTYWMNLEPGASQAQLRSSK